MNPAPPVTRIRTPTRYSLAPFGSRGGRGRGLTLRAPTPADRWRDQRTPLLDWPGRPVASGRVAVKGCPDAATHPERRPSQQAAESVLRRAAHSAARRAARGAPRWPDDRRVHERALYGAPSTLERAKSVVSRAASTEVHGATATLASPANGFPEDRVVRLRLPMSFIRGSNL